jgi:phosphotransferase system HPr (HPr) family protein
VTTVSAIVHGIEYGLHARPAALVVRFASLFEDCRIRVRSQAGDDPVDLKSIMGIMVAGIRANQEVEIQTSGKHELLVARLTKDLLENFEHVVSVCDVRKQGTEDKLHGPHVMFDRFRNLIVAFPGMPTKEKNRLAGKLALFLRIADEDHIVRKDAILNSPKGFHLATVTVITKVARQFRSQVSLVFLDHANRPVSCDAADVFELLNAQAADKSLISIKTVGPDAEVAADLIKDILEHLEVLEGAARKGVIQLDDMAAIQAYLKRLT